MIVVKTINVTNCEDCFNSVNSKTLFGTEIVCEGGITPRAIANRASVRSMLLHKNKVHETCPFAKLNINVKPLEAR